VADERASELGRLHPQRRSEHYSHRQSDHLRPRGRTLRFDVIRHRPGGNNGSDSVSFTIYTVVPDTEPPEITHTPVTDGVEGNPIEVFAIITDESGVEEAELYYRKGSDSDYVSLEMLLTGIDIYTATITASFVDDEMIEYYIFASDGVNEATHPTVAPTIQPPCRRCQSAPRSGCAVRTHERGGFDDSVELTWSES